MKRNKNKNRKRRRMKTERYFALGTKSRYARKARWLARAGLFGFQVPEPKPWRGGGA